MPGMLVGPARGLSGSYNSLLSALIRVVWGSNDQFALANPEVKCLSADVRLQVQTRVSTRTLQQKSSWPKAGN